MSGTTGPSWRAVDLGGVGAVEVRGPTLRDAVGVDTSDLAWWHRCVRTPGSEQPWTREQLLDLPVQAANELANEVMQARPTQPPSGGSGG